MRPRANTLGLIFCNGALLVEEQEGTHSQGTGFFYRPIGGTIEFGETSAEALVREYQEELNVEVEILQYVSCLENIYAIGEKLFHEITQLYIVGFKDAAHYTKQTFTVTEGTKTTQAKWLSLDQLRNPETVLYPLGLLEAIEEVYQNAQGNRL